MDPVGPWYAPYNRLAAAGGGGPGGGGAGGGGGGSASGGGGGSASTADLHHLAAVAATTSAAGSGGPPPPAASAAATAQLLSGGFLATAPPVGAYDAVFSPLFHHAAAAAGAAKPPPPTAAAHYVSQVTQHRAQALAQAAASSKQSGDGEYHPQAQAFFEQGAGAWQQNSPFGILPHESVVATTAGKTVAYENFNAHFAAAQSLNNHINSQLAANSKAANNRSQSPQVPTPSGAKNNASQSNSSSFFQVPVTLQENSNTAKPFTSTNTSNLQQSCIVSSPSTTVSKEYRVPQAPSRSFMSSPNPSRTLEKSFTSPSPKQQSAPQIQTKAQTKIYSELSSQQERNQRSNEENASQSSPISFSIMDAPGRLNYSGSNSSGKRPPQFQHNYRHYQQQPQQQQQQQSTNSEEFQRPKSGSEYQQNNSNGADCSNVVVPRRPSPHQAHSQASPLGHAQSPAYPMYHSPMNSMSSPQQNSSNQQVAPPSPLDVSVPRPNSQTGSSVAYPSVITRALNTDKNYPERYERANQQQSGQQNQQQQNCWDERQQSRKFQNNQSNSQSSGYSSSSSIEIQPVRQVELNRGEGQRQQYFDSNSGHQVTLQDLSSCRGDPMSIVKNLQQQQSCQVQQPEIKQEVKPPIKRRKSVDKVPASPDLHIPSRVPPPAHTSGAANQQQQNGVYFDFDRWNLPPPTSKIFTTTQALHQAQHQGLMVPHPHGHHPPPPLPYFTPFHLANHPGSEFPSTVELTPLTTYNEQQQAAAAAAAAAAASQGQYAAQQQQQQPPQPPPQQQQAAQQQQEDQPKVVVPNIEEELNFLSGDTTPRQPLSSHPRPAPVTQPPKPPETKPTGPGAGFMSSYLKFLQGERETSPPPAVRGSRKQATPTWPKKPEAAKPAETNGLTPVTAPIPPPAPPPPALPIMRLSTQGDPQDDPRYFPLPKERKKGFDSSDDGFSSEDEFFGKKPQPPKPEVKEKKEKVKPPKPPKGPSEKKKQKMQEKLQKQQEREAKQKEKEKAKKAMENVPKREQKKREAKGKKSLSDIIKEDEPEEPPEFQDSEDEDPAWTPAAGNDEEDCLPMKKKSRGKLGVKNKKGMKNLIAAAAQGAGINVGEGHAVEHHKKKNRKTSVPTLEDNIAASLTNHFPTPNNDDNPFKPGEFVALKTELNQEWPAIWRVDGKTLLQKYEPFEQNGVTLYRNISTYTSWTSESKKQYISVPVKYKSQGQLETIVEFLKSEMTIIDHEYQEKCMKQCESYQDNFEVYIQTLISQALDSNFLMEIFQEKDEYFLTNVQTIDEVTDSKKRKMLGVLRWPPTVQAAVCTWPCYNVLRDISAEDSQQRNCAACGRAGGSVAARVLMYGQPYNATTLEGCQPDPNTLMEKDFFMCRICANRVEIASKVIHQKYLMYIECAKRVSEKRTSDPTKDTTCILNELLADESWLNQLFLDVRSLWAEIDCIEHSCKTKNAACAQ